VNRLLTHNPWGMHEEKAAFSTIRIVAAKNHTDALFPVHETIAK